MKRKEKERGGVDGGAGREKEDEKLDHELRELIGKIGWGVYDHISLYIRMTFSKISGSINKEVTFRINAKIS